MGWTIAETGSGEAEGEREEEYKVLADKGLGECRERQESCTEQGRRMSTGLGVGCRQPGMEQTAGS